MSVVEYVARINHYFLPYKTTWSLEKDQGDINHQFCKFQNAGWLNHTYARLIFIVVLVIASSFRQLIIDLIEHVRPN